MAQLTLRVPDEMVGLFKVAARALDRSVNAWATAVLAAAVDPDLAGDEAAITRARLSKAGLLAPPGTGQRPGRPGEGELARARAAAGHGQAMSDFVSENRR